jgi:hypothetical protein
LLISSMLYSQLVSSSFIWRKSKNYDVLQLWSLPPSFIQIFSLEPCSQTLSVINVFNQVSLIY